MIRRLLGKVYAELGSEVILFIAGTSIILAGAGLVRWIRA